jgi:hypothetical protein
MLITVPHPKRAKVPYLAIVAVGAMVETRREIVQQVLYVVVLVAVAIMAVPPAIHSQEAHAMVEAGEALVTVTLVC